MTDAKPVAFAIGEVIAALPLIGAFKTTVSIVKVAPSDMPLYAQSAIDALQSRIDALEELCRAATVYMDNYLLDELEEPELCVEGQHERLQAMFSARRAIDAKERA